MKAVLVIDMPESCGPCRFSTRGTHPFCIATDRTHLVDISKGDRPSWCPLKEMPKKMIPEMVMGNTYAEGIVKGWNDCLEEIER